MPTALEELRMHLSRANSFLTREDWDSTVPTPGKAYVAALMASIAYLEIPPFELEGADRVKIVPCLAYQELALRMQGSAAYTTLHEAGLREAGLRNPEIIVSDDLVAVLIPLRSVIFVALRGTRLFHASDWGDDLNLTHAHHQIGGRRIRFHRGFHDAIAKLLRQIDDRLQAINPTQNIPVYVVGHSLGGAMAGVANTYRDNQFIDPASNATHRYPGLGFRSAYTFGMPRFCDLSGASIQSWLHHTYTRSDFIAYYPPRVLGYANAGMEFCLGVWGGWDYGHRKSWSPSVASLELALGWEPHLLDGYIHRIARVAI